MFAHSIKLQLMIFLIMTSACKNFAILKMIANTTVLSVIYTIALIIFSLFVSFAIRASVMAIFDTFSVSSDIKISKLHCDEKHGDKHDHWCSFCYKPNLINPSGNICIKCIELFIPSWVLDELRDIASTICVGTYFSLLLRGDFNNIVIYVRSSTINSIDIFAVFVNIDGNYMQLRNTADSNALDAFLCGFYKYTYKKSYTIIKLCDTFMVRVVLIFYFLYDGIGKGNDNGNGNGMCRKNYVNGMLESDNPIINTVKCYLAFMNLYTSNIFHFKFSNVNYHVTVTGIYYEKYNTLSASVHVFHIGDMKKQMVTNGGQMVTYSSKIKA